MTIFFLEGWELIQKEVSDLTGCSVSSVSRLLDQMGQMCLVQRYKDPSLGHYVYCIPIDYHNLTINGLEAWIKQAEESIEEIKN
ncbi:MAG: hypothetical protein ACE5R6_20065 [Candidatus Heimdallarchaeota archaeon]